MSVALNAVREELALLRPRVASLESAENILCTAYETPTAPVTAKQPAPRERKRSQSQAPASRGQIGDYIAAHQGCSRAEIVAAVGGRPKSVDNHLARMLAAGQITARGPRGRRRYSSGSNTHVELPKISETASSPPKRGVYPTYDAILELNGATTDQVVAATKLPVARVAEEGRKLLRFGLVRFTDDADERRWSATASGKRA